MTTTHDELVQRAREAIDAVAGDASVVEADRILSLARLVDEIDSHVDTLCGDEEEEDEEGFGDGEYDEDWDDDEDEDDSE